MQLRASSNDSGDDNSNKKPKRKAGGKKKVGKIKINPNWRTEVDMDALAKEFDKMAKADGFDPSSAQTFHANDATFEDEFDYAGNDDDDVTPDELPPIMSDAEMEAAILASESQDKLLGTSDDNRQLIDLDDFDLSDFEELSASLGQGDDDDDDFLDFGSDFDMPLEKSSPDKAKEDRVASMADRITAASRDMDLGRVSIDEELDAYARDVSEGDLRSLGYRRETNPFGDDETPRKGKFALVTNAMACPACGADFQTKNEAKPGFIPQEKYDIQVKLSKIEEVQRLQEKADSSDWSSEDEIEWLIQSEGGGEGGWEGGPNPNAAKEIDVDALAEEMDLDLLDLSKKKVICKRCHGLQNFGEVDESLRPGWTDEPLLSQDAFRDLLKPIGDKPAVIIALVDLFDFSGSVLPELDAIAKDNPVILAANKADLLPSKMGQARAENWVRRELEYLGVQSIANIGGAVRLVSCKTGFGVSGMLDKARRLAEDMECDIYVVGAANAGKSTLTNQILAKNEEKKMAVKYGKKKPSHASAHKGAVTASPLPGTTLKFIEVDIGDEQKLYDTPGLLVPGTLTQKLTPAELKMVVPRKQVEPITFRVASGKCVLVGGLARIEVVGDTKPFLFTFFVSNEIKLHPTDVTKADDFVANHAGEMLTPPLAPGPERMEQIGEFESHTVDIQGAGWKEAAADITLRGLGWVAVTGAGKAQVKISVPKGVGVSVRPPLMPFDVWEATAKYTGGRSVRKSSKSKSGKRRRGVGRR